MAGLRTKKMQICVRIPFQLGLSVRNYVATSNSSLTDFVVSAVADKINRAHLEDTVREVGQEVIEKVAGVKDQGRNIGLAQASLLSKLEQMERVLRSGGSQ